MEDFIGLGKEWEEMLRNFSHYKSVDDFFKAKRKLYHRKVRQLLPSARKLVEYVKTARISHAEWSDYHKISCSLCDYEASGMKLSNLSLSKGWMRGAPNPSRKSDSRHSVVYLLRFSLKKADERRLRDEY